MSSRIGLVAVPSLVAFASAGLALAADPGDVPSLRRFALVVGMQVGGFYQVSYGPAHGAQLTFGINKASGGVRRLRGLPTSRTASCAVSRPPWSTSVEDLCMALRLGW